MKYFQLTVLAILGFIFTSFAQQKVSGKAVIKTPTVHCESCKQRIENYVARQYGVGSVKVDLKKKTTTVTWLIDRTNIEEIKASIATAGYDADDVTAEEDSYKKLPKACQVKDSVIVPAPVN